MNNPRHTKWIVIAAVAIVVICTLFILIKQTDSQQKQNDVAALSEEIQRKEIELRRIEEALISLEREEKKQLQCTGTIEMLFQEPDSLVYNTLAPTFSKYRALGVIVLAGDQLPGMDGNMTEDEFRSLLEYGWEYCWRYDGEGNLQVWYEGLLSAAQSLKIALTDSVYFSENCYQPERDDEFVQLGFRNLIYSDEYSINTQTDLSLVANVLHIQLYELANNEADSQKLNDIIENSENAAGMLSLRGEKKYFSSGDLIYALSTIWAPYINAGQLSICGFSEARTIQAENQRKRALNESPYSEEYVRLQQQIQALNEQLNTLRMRFEQL